MKLNIVEKALFLQNNGYYKIGQFLLVLFCIEFPREVVIPKGETVRKLRPEPAFTQAIRPKS